MYHVNQVVVLRPDSIQGPIPGTFRSWALYTFNLREGETVECGPHVHLPGPSRPYLCTRHTGTGSYSLKFSALVKFWRRRCTT